MSIDWTTLYDRPEILSVEWGYERIFSPQSYAGIRLARALPILMQESALLAQTFPLCWSQTPAGPVLVALLHLLPVGKHAIGGLREAFPLVAQAYPFVVPDAAALKQRRLIVDRTVADQPTDVGAPLILDSGKLSKASLARAKKAMVIAHALPLTDALTKELFAGGFLEPWPLHFELVNDQRIDLDDFLVISAKKLGDPALYRLIEAHGPQAGLFIGLQRLSLFRVMALINIAKAILQREKPPLRELVLQ